MLKRLSFLPITCAVLALAAGTAAHGQEALEPVDLFFAICGGNDVEATESLPGETVERAESPSYFESDLRRTEDYRVTKLENGYAMRAIMRSRVGQNSIIIKCALSSNEITYDDAFIALSRTLGKDLTEMGTEETGKRSMISSGSGAYQLFEERDGWLSLYRLEIMISARDIDPKYLKEGAQPVPIPQAN